MSSMDDSEVSCGYCRRKGSNLKRCSRCLNINYCSKVCQTMAWPGHKSSCVRQSGFGKNRTQKCSKPTDGNEALLETNTEESGIKTTQTDSSTKAPGAEEEIRKHESGFGNGKKEWTSSKKRPDCEKQKLSGAEINLCSSCSSPGCSQKCSRCKEAFYCSKECQGKDWPTHRVSCTQKLTEEEEKIKALHEEMTKQNESHRRTTEGAGAEYTFNIQNFQGPFERLFEMLTLEQALLRATRPTGSLNKATRLARIYFPLHDIVTEFDDIPWEPVFPFFPFMFPPRGGYVLVAFMYRYHEHAMRHGVYLKDAQDKDSKVEFYLDHVGDNPFPFFRYSQVKPGGYICLVDPVMHLFGDGSVGIRINNADEVKVLDIEIVMK